MGSPSTFSAMSPAITTGTSPAPADRTVVQRIWAPAVIAIGLGLTATWAALLGYGLLSLITLLI
jgi:hypothetical protein